MIRISRRLQFAFGIAFALVSTTEADSPSEGPARLVQGTPWVSDGSVAGTRPLSGVLPDYTLALKAGSSSLYAVTYNPGGPDVLWSIDPKTLETSRLGAFPYLADGLEPFGSALGNTLFFRVTEEATTNWWVTEGTPESTHPLPEPLASNTAWTETFFNAGDRRWFTACDSEHGCELWSTDRLGKDTRLVQDLWPGSRGSDLEILTVTEDAIWFAATEPDVGRELWKINLPENP